MEEPDEKDEQTAQDENLKEFIDEAEAIIEADKEPEEKENPGANDDTKKSAENETKGKKGEQKEGESDDKSEEEEQEEIEKGDGKKGGDEEEEEEEEPKIDDAVLERAVKAGLSLGKAKKLAESGALDDVLDLLDSKNEEEEETEEEELPDLDPEQFDENVVNAFNSLKKVVAKQRKEIQALHKSNLSGNDDDFLISEIDGLASEVKPLVTADKKASIEKRILLLEAGYKATGDKSPGKSELFQEAVQHVLGADISKAKTHATAQRSKERSAKIINAPRNQSGKSKKTGGTDSEREVEAIKAVGAIMDGD